MGVAAALQCPRHAVEQRLFDIENDYLAIDWFLQPVGTHCGHESSYGMKETLDSRLKTALDESRLLILGAQVLFGFQFPFGSDLGRPWRQFRAVLGQRRQGGHLRWIRHPGL